MPERKTLYCWEYFSCSNTACPVYGNRGKTCWLEDSTHCHNRQTTGCIDKGAVCTTCPVFEKSGDLDAIKAFMRKHYHSMVMREHQAELVNRSFVESFAHIIDIVEKLCHGDPTARIDGGGSNLLVRKLAEGINLLAESLSDRIDETHEMAIGICEHYDVLNRIAAGDMAACANEHSSNELIAKLGVLINREKASLVSIIRRLQEADEKLSFAYHQMRDIVDFLPDATFVVDSKGEIIAWNKAIEEMTGCPKEEMLGSGERSYSVAFYGEPRPVLLDFLDEDISNVTSHYTYMKRAGDKLYAEAHIPAFRGRGDVYLWVTAAPLIDQDGQRVGAVESVRDITDYRKAELDRMHLEAQLRQSQKMEAIGLLAGGIAHDFNNLLTAIIGYTSLLQYRLGPASDLHHYLDQINISVDRASRLTQDLLAFGRKRILNPEASDLNQIVHNIRGLLSRLLTEDIRFEIIFERDPLLVLVDRGMIEQVLMNLIANARDALPAGGNVTVRTGIVDHLMPPPGSSLRGDIRYAVISVTDNGIGMDAATQEKIFEPFYTTKETGKGTGLGLSTAYGIVSQHEGTITVYSEPGHGTTFRVYLPVLELAPEMCNQPDTASIQTEFAGGDECILLAEDNEETRDVNREILETAGYRVITAENGEEALGLYRKHRHDLALVILDVIMPLMNGREVYEEIRAIDPAARCLFTSGYTADIIHKKGKIEKGVDFLPKPTRPRELLRTVRAILDRPDACSLVP